jgi:adenylate kinase family enzyme
MLIELRDADADADADAGMDAVAGSSSTNAQRMAHHIHLFGASGSGTTTLGRRLAAAIGGRHLDTDAYYWLGSDPPFTEKRSPADRVAMIERDVDGQPTWVLSGSLCGWGDPLLPRFTLAVFLHLDPELRMARLLERERRRYGPRILPGGDLHAQHLAFLEWTRSYDYACAPVRSLDLHERWMARLPCPVLRLDASRTVEALCAEVLAVVGVNAWSDHDRE